MTKNNTQQSGSDGIDPDEFPQRQQQSLAALGGRIQARGNGARCAKDYSPHGEAWDYFSHDQARSRAYR